MTTTPPRPSARERQPDIWRAVFGAYVSAQVHDRMTIGKGYDSDLMPGFVEEAEAVSDDAVDAWEALGRR